MLSEREHRLLARIERQLVESDPDFVRLFAGQVRRGDGAAPTFLLVAGLALLLFGSIAAIVPLAVTGMALSMFALFTAHVTPGGFRSLTA